MRSDFFFHAEKKIAPPSWEEDHTNIIKATSGVWSSPGGCSSRLRGCPFLGDSGPRCFVGESFGTLKLCLELELFLLNSGLHCPKKRRFSTLYVQHAHFVPIVGVGKRGAY